MKRAILIIVVLCLSGCSGIRPTGPERVTLREQAADVEADNITCQDGSNLACHASIEGASVFFMLVREVSLNADWRADAKFDYNTAVASLQRCRENEALCPVLAEHHAKQVADYMAVAELK